MKKTLLVALGLGAAMAASAAAPNYLQQVRANNNLPKANAARVSLAEMPVFNKSVKVNDLKSLKGVTNLATKAAAAASTDPLYLQYYMFQEGLGSDLSGYSMPIFVCPPFTDVAYLNATEQNTTTWTYGVGDQSKAGGETYTSTDKHLTVNYPATYSSAPKLKVADGSEWQPYGEYQGSSVSADVNSTGFADCSLSAQTFGYNWAPQSKETGYLFGSSCNAGVNGYGVFFDMPAAPYYVYSARMLFYNLSLKNDAELTLNVYSVDESGKIGDQIAVGKASAEDVTKVNDAISQVTFKFYEEDDLGGLTQIVLYPETGLFYEFGGFQGDSNIYFDSVIFNLPYIDQDWTIPYTYPIDAGYFIANGNLVPFSEAFDGMSVYGSPILWVDGVLGGIELDKTDNHFADNGGSVELEVNTNAAYLTGYDESPVEYYSVEDEIPDWLTISVSYDATNGTKFQIQADALPAGVTGRRADISFTTVIGGRAKFIATQGDASVSNVAAAASKVNVVDGNFEVESDNATAVEVYNLAGQKVAAATFAGKATVPAADLAKGVYVVKFNDNTVVKVAK